MFPLTKENQRQTYHYINQLHSVRDASSQAKTRNLIFMYCTMQTRISATIIIRFLVKPGMAVEKQ